MGKYSDFERKPRDYYPTPVKAVEPIIDHVAHKPFTYIEPCAGDGRLIKHISDLTDGLGKCRFACDIEPMARAIYKLDVFDLHCPEGAVDYIITNPPWDRKVLHPLIEHCMDLAPTWLLFDANWMHTKQSAALMTYCTKVVSVGRVKWVEDSKGVGKEDACWYLFDANKAFEPTEFYGREV